PHPFSRFPKLPGPLPRSPSPPWNAVVKGPRQGTRPGPFVARLVTSRFSKVSLKGKACPRAMAKAGRKGVICMTIPGQGEGGKPREHRESERRVKQLDGKMIR